MIIEITTDGSTVKNPGPGGWACVFRANGVSKSLYGFDPATTNNKMELMGAIQALEHLSRPCEVVLSCDSQYVVEGITKWIHKWKKNGYIAGDFKRGGAYNTPAFSLKAVKNQDLWVRLDKARERHHVQWIWVRGHAKHSDNLLCDQIAYRAASLQIQGTSVLSSVDTSKIVSYTPKQNEELIRSISFEDI